MLKGRLLSARYPRHRVRGQVRIGFAFLCIVAAAGGFAAVSAVRMTASPSPTGGGPVTPTHHIATAQAGRAWTLGTATATAPREVPVTHPAPALQVARTNLPDSSCNVCEPSMAVDSTGAIYITGPTGIGHNPTKSSSPLWRSTDGGSSFQGPISTETASTPATGVGGGDSDIVVDGQDNLYLTTLWLGNTSVSTSSDGGNTWVEQPIGHATPVDDRPWFAYDAINDAIYMAWDGGDGIHVGKAALRTATSGTAAAPASTLVFAQDVIAVPEVALVGTPAGGVARECVCAPGTLAVDSNGGVHLAFSSQNGVGIATSTDGGVTWNNAYVPGSATGTASDLSNDFQWLRSDTEGNLYVTWTQSISGGQRVLMSWLHRGATDWQKPVVVSTTKDGVFGTLAVVSPGVVDLAYYGTNDTGGDAASAPAGTSWDVHLVQAQDLFTAPTFIDDVAMGAVHTGSIDTNGISGTSDRSLGDFFSLMVDGHGMAAIVTATGNSTSGTSLIYIRQTAPLSHQAVPPSAPSAAAGSPLATAGGPPGNSAPVAPAAPLQPAQQQQQAGGGSAGDSVSMPTAAQPATTPSAIAVAVNPTAAIPMGQRPSLPLWAPLLVLIGALAGGGVILNRMSRR